MTESVVYAAKQVKSQIIKKKQDDVDLDANDKAMQNAVAVARHSLDSLKVYRNRLLRINDDEGITGGQRLREMAKNNSAICDVIQDLSVITEHLQIVLRIELLSRYLSQEIHDSKHQYLLRKTQIECTNNNHLMTDVLKDYLKKSNANKKRSNKIGLGFRTASKSMMALAWANMGESAKEDFVEPEEDMTSVHPILNPEDRDDQLFADGTGFKSAVVTGNFLKIEHVISKLNELDTWDDVNVFEMHENTEGHTLLLYLPMMFERFQFIGDGGKESSLCIDKSTMFKFVNLINTEGYNRIPYHSAVHAADVLQTVFFWITRESSEVLGVLTQEDIFAMLIGAAIHDYQHPGVSHPYLIQAEHTSRFIYNDRDILENFHLCQAFKMLKQNDLDIFKRLTKTQRRVIKRNIVDCVLATNFGHQRELIFDMTNDPKYVHGKSKDINDLSKREIRRTRSILRPLLLHASDISHCFKREEIHLEWSERYFQEYYIEKGMFIGLL